MNHCVAGLVEVASGRSMRLPEVAQYVSPTDSTSMELCPMHLPLITTMEQHLLLPAGLDFHSP